MAKLIIAYFLLINVITFFVYGLDKLKAKKQAWRIPEAVLLMLAVIGGSIGALIGMKVWHHKTLHNKFRFGVPIILILQVIIALYFILT